MKLDNKNIVCTVSSGYSSALMAYKIREWYPNHNIVFVFANTGKEHIKSLEFLKNIDEYYNLKLNYIQADINKKRGSNSYQSLKYHQLDKEGIVFEEGIKKYGIPSVANPWCTRELKNNPIEKFANDLFGKGNYSIALGIRADEIDRVSKNYKTNNIFYPLIENNITSKHRNAFFDIQYITLDIPAYKGNCKICFKKSNRKNMTHILEEPNEVKWYIEMQQKYSNVKIKGKKQYNEMIDKYDGAYFFRGNITIEELVEMAKRPFNKATDEYVYESDLFDKEEDCGKGCVIFNKK